jgi:pyridinium-3,5-biscarboxylic acid mononucleotide sulfurtransferase
VRLHDKLARIEVAPEELPRAMNAEMAAKISARFKEAGFLYVALDLEGYRQGSLNAALKVKAGSGSAGT